MTKLNSNTSAYTLIELLITMPIIALITGFMFSIIFNLYGNMLLDTQEANLRLEAQTMLLNLEDELLFTTEYGSVIKSDLSDPYAPPGGWKDDPDGDVNTQPDWLIVYETALDSDRRDPDRNFIYKNNYGCGSSYNPIAINNLIYFTEENPDDIYKTLYKRTIIPQYSTCGVNFKEMSCPEINVNTGSCTRGDGRLTDKLVDFKVDYYNEDNVLTLDPGEAEKIEVFVTLGEKIYGKEITVESKFIMKKIN